MRWAYLIAAMAALAAVGWLVLEDDSVRQLKAELEGRSHLLDSTARYLRAFHAEHGRYPTNDEGMRHADSPLLWATSRQGLVYENRNGIGDADFAYSSRVMRDGSDWAAEVDKGVYVWCVGALLVHRDYVAARTRWLLSVAASACAFVAMLALYLRAAVLARRMHEAGTVLRKTTFLPDIGILAAAVVAVILHVLPVAPMHSCYRMIVDPRQPQIAQDYREVLRKYREEGIISEKAYRRMMDTANERRSGRMRGG